MLVRIISTFVLCFGSVTTAQAAKFSCPVTGGTQSAFKVSKGKIGNYRAKVVGKEIRVKVPGAKLIIKSNGKALLNGTSYGKMQCNMAKVRRVVSGG